MKETSYVILTDSCSDLTPELVKEADLNIIPMTFRLGEQDYMDYPDNREIDMHKFYDELRNGKLSRTSQITPGKYIEILTPFLKDGKDILLLVFSSALSSTYDSAKNAASFLRENFPERKIEIIDSLSASGGQGFLAYHLGLNRNLGMSLTQNVLWANNNRLHIAHWFTIDSLQFLRRGGRLTASKAWLGTLLSLKPVLHVDNLGQLVPISNVRGRKQSLLSIAKQFKETAVDPTENMVMILHADDEDDAKLLGNLLIKKYAVPKVIYSNIGPVIGSHSGPNTIALFFFATKR